MLRFLIPACCAALPLSAQTLTPCQDHFAGSVHSVAEPLEDNTATYANGAIRVILMDVEDPACCSFFLAVLHPAGSEPDEQYRLCSLISMEGNLGFKWIDFGGRAAAYDPVHGLTLGFAAEFFDGVGSDAGIINFTINQATGEVLVQ